MPIVLFCEISRLLRQFIRSGILLFTEAGFLHQNFIQRAFYLNAQFPEAFCL